MKIKDMKKAFPWLLLTIILLVSLYHIGLQILSHPVCGKYEISVYPGEQTYMIAIPIFVNSFYCEVFTENTISSYNKAEKEYSFLIQSPPMNKESPYERIYFDVYKEGIFFLKIVNESSSAQRIIFYSIYPAKEDVSLDEAKNWIVPLKNDRD